MSDRFIYIHEVISPKETGPSQALGPMAQMAQLLSRRPKIGAMGEVKGEIFRKSEKMGKPWSMQV